MALTDRKPSCPIGKVSSRRSRHPSARPRRPRSSDGRARACCRRHSTRPSRPGVVSRRPTSGRPPSPQPTRCSARPNRRSPAEPCRDARFRATHRLGCFVRLIEHSWARHRRREGHGRRGASWRGQPVRRRRRVVGEDALIDAWLCGPRLGTRGVANRQALRVFATSSSIRVFADQEVEHQRAHMHLILEWLRPHDVGRGVSRSRGPARRTPRSNI